MKEKRLKVIFLQDTVLHYRVATFNEIAKEVDFTIAYCNRNEAKGICLFDTFRFKKHKIGPFYFADKSLREKCKEYDVVCFMPDLHIVTFCMIPFRSHKYKTVCWGVGMRASYTKQYDVNRKHEILDRIFAKIMNASDACAVYMPKTLDFWTDTQLNKNKCFVAINTVPVESINIRKDRTDFLFVGTLYKKKGVDVLISSFYEASKRVKDMPFLHIVGKGPEREDIEKQVRELGLQEKVIFHGPIYDEKELCKLFEKSVLCISPNQAGLSVPKSMGYGVAFVTRKDAVTGGEITHIVNGETGVLYDKDSDLIEIMVESINTPEKYISIGISAYDYYNANATPKHMANGALNAIYYAMNH